MNLITRLWRNKLWKLCRIETKDIWEVLVFYSFRHKYSKASHAKGFHITNIYKGMGHSQDVQLQNYSKFIPDRTSEMYNKAYKAIVWAVI